MKTTMLPSGHACARARVHSTTWTEPQAGAKPVPATKLLLRHSFAMLIFIMLIGTASVSTTLWFPVASAPALEQPWHDLACLNDTLLCLAASDPSEPLLGQTVDALLDERLPASAFRAKWGQDNINPNVRRSLRSWHHLHHYDPSILSRLRSLLSISERIPSCAVVGNSGILLRANHGAHIDSHAAVFRLNNARISHLSRYVGSKTNFTFMHSWILRVCARYKHCFCNPYGPHVPILLFISEPTHFIDIAACNATFSYRHSSPISVMDARLHVLCKRIVKYYSLRRFVAETGRAPDEWDGRHNATKFLYSSGMQAIMVAVGLCDRVSVFGFGKSSDAKHHYHDNQMKEASTHDYEAEYTFYHDLSKRPHLVPFLNDSDFTVPPVIVYH